MFILESAVYRRATDWSVLVSQGKDAIAHELGRAIGTQIETAIGDFPASEVGMNMVVTTMLDMPFTSGWITWPEVAAAARTYTRSPPQNLVSAYECSSWGFVLRYAKPSRMDGPLAVITVLDLNIFNLSYWDANPNWGTSGFGIATLVVRCSDADSAYCHVAKAANGFGEFCIDLRNHMIKDSTILVTPPFFPPNISALYDRLLPADRLLPNRVDTYGHSFGADPWISLIEQRLGGHDTPQDRYLATSVSLNGYWCCAEISLAPQGRFILQDTLVLPAKGLR